MKDNNFLQSTLQKAGQAISEGLFNKKQKAIALSEGSIDRTFMGGTLGDIKKTGLPKPTKVTFDQLRMIADYDTVIRICIDSIKNTVSQAEWNIVPKRAYQTNYKQEHIDQLTEFFEYVNTSGENLRSLLASGLEDLLVLDAFTLETPRDIEGNIKELISIDSACYSDDTEVLTKNGWKFFKDVDIEKDKFATRNKITKKFEWQKATYQHRREYKGEMYHFHSRTLDVLVSPNHRMLVTNSTGDNIFPERIKLAKDLRNDYSYRFLPATSDWDGVYIEKKQFISKAKYNGIDYEFDGDDYVSFMGMYLSEGSIEQGGTKNRIYITQKYDSKGFNDFQELLVRMFGKEPYYNGKDWEFRNKPLWEFLKQFGKARTKFIPDDIMNAEKEQLKLFWYFYMLGDGYFDRNRKIMFTSSKKMADQLQEIIQKMGYSSSIRERLPEDKYIQGRKICKENCVTNYAVSLRTSKTQTYSIKKIDYDGEIHCVSVPNEILYVRRKGQPIWCGNTIRPVLNKYGEVDPARAYVQVIGGKVVAEFAANEIIYIMQYPKNDIKKYGYGSSPIESILLTVQAALNADLYNAQTFSNDNIPPGMLDLGNMSTEEANKYIALWNATVIKNTQKMKFVWGSDNPHKFIPFKTNNKDMQYMKYIDWLSRLKLAKYGLTGMEANIVQDVNRSTSETMSELSRSRGVNAVFKLIEEYWNRQIINPMGIDDVEFKFVREVSLEQKLKQAEIDKIYIETGVVSPQEVAKREGFEGYDESELFSDEELLDGGASPNPADGEIEEDVIEEANKKRKPYYKPLYK